MFEYHKIITLRQLQYPEFEKKYLSIQKNIMQAKAVRKARRSNNMTMCFSATLPPAFSIYEHGKNFLHTIPNLSPTEQMLFLTNFTFNDTNNFIKSLNDCQINPESCESLKAFIQYWVPIISSKIYNLTVSINQLKQQTSSLNMQEKEKVLKEISTFQIKIEGYKQLFNEKLTDVFPQIHDLITYYSPKKQVKKQYISVNIPSFNTVLLNKLLEIIYLSPELLEQLHTQSKKY